MLTTSFFLVENFSCTEREVQRNHQQKLPLLYYGRAFAVSEHPDRLRPCLEDYLHEPTALHRVDSDFVPLNTSVTTPILENLKLLGTEEEILNTRQSQWVFTFPCRKLIGTILYVNVCIRPTAVYAISMLAQFNNRPTFKALVRLA